MGNPKGPAGYAIDPAGNPVSLAENQLEAATNTGFKPVTGDIARALQQAANDKQYVDENWGTMGQAAMGAASGLTLGLAPSIASRMGIVDRGHLEAAQESGAYTAGDVAGMIAPALLTGGEAVGARGVIGTALRATPAGLMSGAGGLTERLVARMLPEAGILGKAASGTIKMAARGATEGALISSAHQASQDIIQNKPLAAQSLLAAGAQGALFGGAVGGLLGGAGAVAGAGVDMVSARASKVVGSGGEDAAAKALRHIGVSDVEQAAIRAGDASGSLIPSLRKYVDVIDGVEGVGQKTSTINAMARMAEKQSREVAADAVSELTMNHPTSVPSFGRMDARIVQDVSAQFEGTLSQREAKNILLGARKDMGNMKTWENWTSSREMLADRVAATGGTKQEVYKTVLNAFDSELRTAMEQASPELAATYGAAVTKARNAAELAKFTSVKGAAETGSKLELNGADASTMGYGLVGGHPLMAGGIVAGKKISAYIQDKLEPVIAEYAARSALGASAAGAQVRVGRRISEGLQDFIQGGRQVATSYGTRTKSAARPSYSVKAYGDSMRLTEELTSQAHQAKVRETTEALANAGHEDLANEMAMTYGRAVAYINATKPKGRSPESRAGKLTKSPKDFGVSTQGMKFIRIFHAIADPIGSLIDGLRDGSISREAVAAVKYVYPHIHKDVVVRASQKFVALKNEGKSLPADKVAMIGTLLDAPVDTTLNPEFIAEIQKAHAANKGSPPDPGRAPPPNTDISSYQTPLQSSV